MDQHPASSNEVIFVLIPQYADWEPALLAAGLCHGFAGMWQPRYRVSIAAPSLAPVSSVGTFNVVPNYTFESMPSDYAALILVGGTDWFGPDSERVVPLVKAAMEKNRVIGAICDATIFLGVHGFLNTLHHTSNNLDELKAKAGARYTGEQRYHADQPSVRDSNLVTANGAGFIEFARNVFEALEVAPPQAIDMFYQVCKKGLYPQGKAN